MKITIEYDEERMETLKESFDEIISFIPKSKLSMIVGNMNDIFLLIDEILRKKKKT